VWSSHFSAQLCHSRTVKPLVSEPPTRSRASRGPTRDAAHPLLPVPWFEPGARWSARRVLLHMIAETAQHADHADIIRGSLDGTKSMG
jgi:hypothetical protein